MLKDEGHGNFANLLIFRGLANLEPVKEISNLFVVDVDLLFVQLEKFVD